MTTTSSSSSSPSSMLQNLPADLADNPFLQQDGLPKFASLAPEHLDAAIAYLLDRQTTAFATLEAALEDELAAKEDTGGNTSDSSPITTTATQLLATLERIQAPLDYAWGVASHLNGVKNGDALRAAYEKNQPRIVQASSSMAQSLPVYRALCQIQAKDHAENAAVASGSHSSSSTPSMTGPERRAVDLAVRSMTLGGVGLEDGADKDRFNDIKQRLATLRTSFGNHVLDATKAFGLVVDSKDASLIKGVPASAKTLWAKNMATHLENTSDTTDATTTTAATPPTAEAGPWRITLDFPSLSAVLSHVPDRALRQKVYMAYITRASDVGEEKDDSQADGTSDTSKTQNNVPLVYEILQLKQSLAQLLGYDTYADVSLASKMAPSQAAVTRLSDLILDTALPAAHVERDAIVQLSGLDTLEPWDVKYWTERLKEQTFSLTEEDTRPYFALPAVLEGMFQLVRRLFQIEVRVIDNTDENEHAAEVWHPDVQFFHIYDASTDSSSDDATGTKKHIASFYLDPYSRPEDKRGGAWMGTCIGKSAACGRDIAVAYLTCNGSPPNHELKQPSLMTFREVETLFHEFGHGLQHMLTTCPVGDVAGINGVEWDAVELPSQFMENWCYDKPTIYGFARHWETGEALPEEMYDKLVAQKTFNAGMMACRQLLFGQLDMELHANYNATTGAAGDGESIFEVHRRMAQKYTPYSLPVPEDRFLCAFSHIFAGGYAAGYFSYKWAEVMSADAFSAFEDVGLDNEEEVQRVGMEFRRTVLSLGGGQDPMTVFTTFRGREPSPEAILRHNGLVKAAM